MSDLLSSPKNTKPKKTNNPVSSNQLNGKLVITLTVTPISNVRSIQRTIAQSLNQSVDVYDTRFTLSLLGQQHQSIVSTWPSLNDQSTWRIEIDLAITRDLLIMIEKAPFTLTADTKHVIIPYTSISQLTQTDDVSSVSPLPSKRQIDKVNPKPGSASTKKKPNQLNTQTNVQSNDPQTLINAALEDVAFVTSSPFILPLSSLLAAPYEVSYESRSNVMSCSLTPGLVDWQLTMSMSSDPISPALKKELIPMIVRVQSIQPSISSPLSYDDMDRVYRPITLSIGIGDQTSMRYPTHWQFNHMNHILLPPSLNRIVVFLGLLSQSDWLSLSSESSGLNVHLSDRDHRCVKTVEEAEAEETAKKLKDQQQIEQERKRLSDKRKKGAKSPTNNQQKDVIVVPANAIIENELFRPQTSSPLDSALSSLDSASYDARSNVHGRGVVSINDLFRCTSKPSYSVTLSDNEPSDEVLLVDSIDAGSIFKFNVRVPLHAVFPHRLLPLIPPQTRSNQYQDACLSLGFELDSESPLPTRASLRDHAAFLLLVVVMSYDALVYSDLYSQIVAFNEEALGLPTEARVRGALARASTDQLNEQADYVSGISICDGLHRWMFLEVKREGNAVQTIRQTLEQAPNQLLWMSPNDDTMLASSRIYSNMPVALQHCRLRSSVVHLIVPHSINANSFDCLCLLRSLIARETNHSIQPPLPSKCCALEREFGSSVSDADVFGARLSELEEQLRKKNTKQLAAQSAQEYNLESNAAAGASKRERAALDAVKRKATSLMFSSNAHEEQHEWKAQSTKKNDQIKAPVFMYSTPQEYDQQVERIREFCHSDPRLHWTFHPDFLHSSIPRYESKEQVEQLERAESKSKWLDPRGFIMPSSSTGVFSTTPLISETERTAEAPKLTIEQRVDARRNHRVHVQAAKRELAFNLTPITSGLFDSTPQASVHRQNDQQISEQRTREAEEKLERQNRVCVDDETFHIAVGKSVGNCKLESIAPIRHDTPRKQALKFITKDGRSLAVQQLPVSITNTDPYKSLSEFKFRESTINPNEPEFVRYTQQHEYVYKPRRDG